MIGIAGNEKDDARITIDLSYNNKIEIEIISKMKNIFEEQVTELIISTLNKLQITNAKVTYEDFGGLDFIIKARIKSAVRKAKGVQ